MRTKLLKLLFTFSLFITTVINAQDQIKLNSIKVNGVTYNSSSTVNLYKGTSATLTVNYSIIKNTPTWEQSGNQVRFNARTIAGPPYHIKYDNQSWPYTQYTSGTYEFTANIPNTNALIENNNSGRLYLVYDYGLTNSTSNSINVNFTQPSVSSNTISGGVTADYLTTGPTITGSDVSVPVGSYKIYWQRKNPVANGHWYNISSGTINTKDYSPLAAENRYHYKVRRYIQPTSPGISDSYSNEVDVRVNIGENFITDSPVDNKIIGSEPKGGSGSNTYTYQWQEKINGSWNNILNATQINYSISQISPNRVFRRIVKSPFAADSISNEIKITPRIIGNSIKLDFYVLFPNEQVLSGEIPNFNRLMTFSNSAVTSTNGQSVNFQWQSKTELGNWTDISGANTEIYTINTPLFETTHFRRLVTSSNINTNESNIIIIPISGNSKTENNIISFDPLNNDHILGTYATGGTGSYSYVWAIDVHPDDSIGEIIEWATTADPNTFLSYYINIHPVTSDEYRITRYAVSDNVWHKSNTLIYSLSGGIIQGRKAIDTKLELENKRETIAFIQNNELKFNFKNYQNYQAEIYIGNIATGQSVKAANHNIKNNNDSYLWNFPSHYLPGVYVYRIIFSDGTIKTGKVIRK